MKLIKCNVHIISISIYMYMLYVHIQLGSKRKLLKITEKSRINNFLNLKTIKNFYYTHIGTQQRQKKCYCEFEWKTQKIDVLVFINIFFVTFFSFIYHFKSCCMNNFQQHTCIFSIHSIFLIMVATVCMFS